MREVVRELLRHIIAAWFNVVAQRRTSMKKSRELKVPLVRRKMQLAMTKLSETLGNDRFEPAVFEIEEVCVTISNLDPAFEGYRLVSVSDIHLGQWLSAKRLGGVIGLINQQHPDLVAITGDLFSYEVDRVAEDMIASLKKLHPRDASVAVLGNHDHLVGAEKVRNILWKSNVIDVSNDVHTITKNGETLHVAGVDSVMLGKHRLDLVLEKLPPSGPAILLAHEPDFADISATTGRFSLQISGHSHGGQFVIPGMGALIRGAHCIKYPLGQYQVGDMVHYTSRGLGTNVFWVRINCPPEITIFTLKAKVSL